jgi:hypothetical protein
VSSDGRVGLGGRVGGKGLCGIGLIVTGVVLKGSRFEVSESTVSDFVLLVDDDFRLEAFSLVDLRRFRISITGDDRVIFFSKSFEHCGPRLFITRTLLVRSFKKIFLC